MKQHGKETFISGNTIVSDSYSPFGTLNPDLPKRRDKTTEEREAERRADRIDHDAVLKTFGWTQDDLSRALAFGFPSGTALFSSRGQRRLVYSRQAIAKHIETLAGYADSLQRGRQ